MSIFKTIGHWFTKDGWIGKLFSKNELGNITVNEAAEKVDNALEKILYYESSINIITEAISDDVDQSSDEVVAAIKLVKQKLSEVKDLQDVGEELAENVVFSPDPRLDDFIKDEIKMIAVASNDGKISILEAAPIIARAISFIKGN